MRFPPNWFYYCSAYLLQDVTRLLQIHEFVHIIALDFSKAFDTVRHHTLVSKMADFPLPDNLHNWIVNYLSDRQHQTKLNGIASSLGVCGRHFLVSVRFSQKPRFSVRFGFRKTDPRFGSVSVRFLQSMCNGRYKFVIYYYQAFKIQVSCDLYVC